MLLVLIFFLTGFQSLIWAHIQIGEPILSGETLFTFSVETSTVFRPTICFVSSGRVSQCRRKRGIEEKPHMVSMTGDQDSIIPSAVIGIEATLPPNSLANNADTISSSLMDDRYFHRRLEMNRRSNRIAVGDCGQTTVNFSQFLSCLGFNFQEKTTLTATYTETTTVSTGYTTIGVVWGCTPAGFPYVYCSEGDKTESSNSYPSNANDEGFTFPVISMGIDDGISTESSTYPAGPAVSEMADSMTDMVSSSCTGEILSTYPQVPEIVDDDNNSHAASTTNEFPTYTPDSETIQNVFTIEVSTEVSTVSTADEIQIRPPIFTTVSGESSTYSTVSSETIDYISISAADINTDSEVAPTSPLIPIAADQGDSAIYPSVDETVESENSTEEGLT